MLIKIATFIASIAMLLAALPAVLYHTFASALGSSQVASALSASALSATVTIGTQNYVFDCASGVDAGDYVDPQGQFTEGDLVVSRADTPLTVDCRLDKTSSHAELVFSLFKAWGAANAAAANLGAYTVVIKNN